MPKRNAAAAVGLVLGCLGVASYFAFVVPVLSPQWPGLRETPLLNAAIVAAGLLLSARGVRRALGRRPTHRGRRLAPLLAGVNLACAAFFAWYLFDFSHRLPDASATAPGVGAVAPDIALTDQRGAPLRLADLRGRNVLLVFYRGFW